MNRSLTWLSVAACLAFAGAGMAGCLYKPSVPDGAVRCDDSQRCPTGLTCNAVRDGALVLLVCCKNVGCGGAGVTSSGLGSGGLAVGTAGSGGAGGAAVTPQEGALGSGGTSVLATDGSADADGRLGDDGPADGRGGQGGDSGAPVDSGTTSHDLASQ